MVLRSFALSCAVCLLSLSYVAAQGTPVDVYLITGQSNGNNFAKQAGLGSNDLGFTLHFARVADTFGDFPNHTAVATRFTSNSVNGSLATSILAENLHQDGRDVAIFTFARNGAGLHRNLPAEGGQGNEWIWYPGSDPATGQIYQDSLYANSVTWFNSRLQELVDAGLEPEVKGLFWFQGEKDARLGKIDPNSGGLEDHLFYAQNFDNLTFRFREDFGADLPIVVATIREFSTSATEPENVINAALAQAATNDPLTGIVPTQNLSFRNATNVHLDSAGLAQLAPLWSAEMLNLQAPSVLLGDCNQDGFVNFLDISPFIALLSTDDFLAEADVNEDGEVDFSDIGPFISLLSQ